MTTHTHTHTHMRLLWRGVAAGLLCVALLGGSAAEAQAQSEPDACAGTEGAGRLTPDNEQWPNRDRIAALKTSHPELWRKVCRDLPYPDANGGGGPVLVSNLGQASGTGWDLSSDRAQRFRTGSNAKGYVLDSVDVSFLELSDPRAFSRLSVTVRDSSGARVVGTLVPPAFEATSSERAYRFEAFGISNGLPGINLAPSTTYMLVLDVTSGWSGSNTLTDTRSDSEDRGGASGWSIDNNHQSRIFASTGSFTFSPVESLKIGLNGSPRPAGAAPWVRIDVADTAEGSSMTVTATIAANHSEALWFYVEMRECDWHPPTTKAYFDPAAHDATAACAAAAPGAGYAREADFNMWHPDGSARAFIHIAAGSTSGRLELPAVGGDGTEGSEAIAFMVTPYREAARAYVGYASGRHWHHPATPPDGYSGNRHPLWVGRIHASTGGTPIGGSLGGSLIPDGARVGGRGLSEPAVDATLVSAVRDLAGQTHHGQAHVDRWRRVLIAFGLETYDGLTATTAAEARDNAATYHSPLWPQIADVLAKLQTPDPPQDTPQQDPPQDGGTQDGTPQDGGTQDGTPQDGGTQDGTPQDGGTQDGGTQDGGTQDGTPQDPPQQGYTVDAAVVTKVRALAEQTHHGPVHVNRWNRVLVAFGEHDGTGVTGGPMTLDEAEANTRRHSSPVWNEVVAELTKLKAAQ